MSSSLPASQPSPTKPPTAAVADQLVASITAAVLQRLTAGGLASSSAPALTAPQVAPSPTAPMPAAAAATPRPEKLITLATVNKLPRETRDLLLRADAVVTPSARELLHDRGILLRRLTSSTATAATTPSFLVATVENGRTAGDAAAIVRALPAAQQLPSLGLEALIDAFAEAALRGGSRGLLLSSRPAAAVVIANRKKAIRAVTARSVREALDAAAECRATLLVVDPRQIGSGGLRRLAVEFAKQVHEDLPADLVRACTPCGCSPTSQEARG